MMRNGPEEVPAPDATEGCGCAEAGVAEDIMAHITTREHRQPSETMCLCITGPDSHSVHCSRELTPSLPSSSTRESRPCVLLRSHSGAGSGDAGRDNQPQGCVSMGELVLLLIC